MEDSHKDIKNLTSYNSAVKKKQNIRIQVALEREKKKLVI